MPTAPTTVADFVALTAKSGLATEEALHRHIEQFRSKNSVEQPLELAKHLVREGVLTPFQVSQLLAGKYQRFVLSGKYKILDRLGIGGMATVFLCEHIIMRRLVALKVLPPEQSHMPVVVERFHREARAVARLNHPNIVRAHDVDREENVQFLVMEFVDGVDLFTLVKAHGRLSLARAANYITQAALGLQHAHEGGLVHRDIKPNNLLLDRSGTLKILDLGLARFFRDDKDQLTVRHEAQAMLGTVDYIAPEQAIQSSNADIRSDIYSLAVTFFYLLTADIPFGGRSVAQKIISHQTLPPRPLANYRDDVPAELEAVLHRMLAKAPADRYQEPIEVVHALQPWTPEWVDPPADAELPRHVPAIRQLLGIDSPAPVATRATRPRSSPMLAARVTAGGRSSDPSLPVQPKLMPTKQPTGAGGDGWDRPSGDSNPDVSEVPTVDDRELLAANVEEVRDDEDADLGGAPAASDTANSAARRRTQKNQPPVLLDEDDGEEEDSRASGGRWLWVLLCFLLGCATLAAVVGWWLHLL